MQAIPTNFVLGDQQAYLRQDTDTAHPRTPIPIYYIHDGDTPFCHNPRCFCQRGKRAGAMLYGEIAKMGVTPRATGSSDGEGRGRREQHH